MSTKDLIVVGAGIIGLATAFRAHCEGRSVHVIDRADRPVGSSIQNFGHACFTGQSDDVQSLMEKSREGWLEAAQAVGLWAAESGTLVPAVTEVEMQILQEFSAHRGAGKVVMLDAEQTSQAVGNPQLGAVGGAHLVRDLRVNPREAAPKIAAWLAGNGVKFTWNTHVTKVAEGTVYSNRGDFNAEEVVVCTNFELVDLFPEMAERHELEVCTLVMSLIERPERFSSDFSMLTGTSLARYGGFSVLPSHEALRAELAVREPELTGCIANLMVTGIPEGLLIGDSHAYAKSPEPFIDERIAQLLLDKATNYLGIGKPVIKQRWLGRYANSVKTDLILEKPDARTTVAVVASGIGMTYSFGLADRIIRGDF